MSLSDTVAAERAPARSHLAALPRWQLLWLLGALSCFAPLSTDMYLPALPSLAHDLSASASAAQLTLTASMVGLGFGQLLAGPLSDAFGRRVPVLLGLLAYTLASVACAAATSIWMLTALRVVQGAAGAAGIVVARAIVRDLFDGVEAARFFGRLVIVFGLAPILAPLIGGALLHVTDWRGIFVALAAIGALLLLVCLRTLSETLPHARRQRGGVRVTMRTLGVLVADRRFSGLTAVYALSFGAFFAYIAASPFVLENIFGLSPVLFGVVFGCNAAALVTFSQVGAHLVARIGPHRLATIGLCWGTAAAVGFLVSALSHAPLAAVLICFFALAGGYGLVSPNLTAEAMAPFKRIAGSASALMGLAQFTTGAAVAPLVGLAGTHSALPAGIVIASTMLVSFVVWQLLPAHGTAAIDEG
ncbi:MAG TPA: multidrug effflux MFS transporter [Solirubrobacteraceae bacterium]|jgi:DHA1 family bicyclomycin/chloramphenicol resistance-like MFS transporter